MLDKKYFKKIKEITIPHYVHQVQISNKRLTKYYHQNSGRGKVKKAIEDIPKKYGANCYDLEGYAVDKDFRRIIANPLSAGKARFVPINGQIFYSQKGGQFTRAKIVQELHSFYKDHLENFTPFTDKQYPLVIQMNWFCPYGHKTMDSTNMYFAYQKTFEDVLTNLGIIEDDEVRYVTGGFPIYTPIDSFEDRKLVFTFYTDMRAEIQQFKLNL